METDNSDTELEVCSICGMSKIPYVIITCISGIKCHRPQCLECHWSISDFPEWYTQSI